MVNASATTLVLANLFPLAGVLYMGWSLTELVFIYWLENLIIGVFNIIKMLFGTSTFFHKLATIIFFSFIYGVFWITHGVFLFAFVVPAINEDPNIGTRTIDTSLDLSIPSVLIILTLSHLISFFLNFMVRGRHLAFDPADYMFSPFGRVFILHILIIGSAFLANKFGASLVVLALIIGLKIVVDLIAHLISNDLYRKEPASWRKNRS